VYYIHFAQHAVFVLITIFAKNEMAEMSDAGKKAVAHVVREIEGLIEKGEV
jgi:hypothetical protein